MSKSELYQQIYMKDDEEVLRLYSNSWKCWLITKSRKVHNYVDVILPINNVKMCTLEGKYKKNSALIPADKIFYSRSCLSFHMTCVKNHKKRCNKAYSQSFQTNKKYSIFRQIFSDGISLMSHHEWRGYEKSLLISMYDFCNYR